MDFHLADNPFVLSALFLGGRDVVRMASSSTNMQDVMCGATLDLHTAFRADIRLTAKGLFKLATGKRNYNISGARIHSGAVTRGGGTELIALSISRSLRILDLSHCVGLTSLDSLGSCAMLEELNVSWCTALKKMSGLDRCTKLAMLNAGRCECLEDVSALRLCLCLRSLVLNFCTLLQAGTFLVSPMTTLVWVGSNLADCLLPSKCSELRVLNLSGSSNLVNVNALACCPLLQELDLFLCIQLLSLDGLEHLRELEVLSLDTCSSLESISVIADLPKLENLNLNSCTGVADFTPLIHCRSLLSVSLHDCRLTSNVDIESFGSLKCAVSSSVDIPLPGSPATRSKEAALSASRGDLVQHCCPAACSRYDRTLQSLCLKLGAMIGIFWEDRYGVLSFAGAHIHASERKLAAHAFVAGSECCSFRPSVDVPGRALSFGMDWVEDVELLTQASFPRRSAAVIAGIRTAFAFVVPGGVAEFCYDEVIQELSYRYQVETVAKGVEHWFESGE